MTRSGAKGKGEKKSYLLSRKQKKKKKYGFSRCTGLKKRGKRASYCKKREKGAKTRHLPERGRDHLLNKKQKLQKTKEEEGR